MNRCVLHVDEGLTTRGEVRPPDLGILPMERRCLGHQAKDLYD